MFTRDEVVIDNVQNVNLSRRCQCPVRDLVESNTPSPTACLVASCMRDSDADAMYVWVLCFSRARARVREY